MENRSFEGELPGGNPPNDPKDNDPGPLNPGASASSDNKDQAKDSIPPLARISDDEDDEYIPAYRKRYEPPEPKTDNFEDLEPPPPEPIQEPHDVRSDPELQLQAKRRRERRHRQISTEGPCSLRPNRPTVAPPDIPEPYPDLDISQQGDNEPDTGLQAASAPDPGLQAASAPDPGLQAASAPDPGLQGANAPDPGLQAANAPDPGLQAANAPDPGLQAANAPDPGRQAANAPGFEQRDENAANSGQQTAYELAAIWECVSSYRQINGFHFQFLFNILLLTWPISTCVMGILNLVYCSMNLYFPFLMIVIGLSGTVVALIRLYVMYYERRFTSVGNTIWIVIRSVELAIWVLFASQLFYFFEQNPSFTPGAKLYCKPRIYKINCGLMFVTSATMIGWIIVNIRNFIHWISWRNERPSA